jgi:hypothetical protein
MYLSSAFDCDLSSQGNLMIMPLVVHQLLITIGIPMLIATLYFIILVVLYIYKMLKNFRALLIFGCLMILTFFST